MALDTPPTDNPTLQEQYAALAHAIQTGVGYLQHTGISPDNIKHLRVGINMLMCEVAAIESVLTEKGICTEDELWAKRVEFLKKEVAGYETLLTQHYSKPVKLA